AGERVAHVRRLTVECEVAASPVADLLAAVVVRDHRGEWIELHRRQSELLPITIDDPKQLFPKGAPSLVRRTDALRQRRGDHDRGEQDKKLCLHERFVKT